MFSHIHMSITLWLLLSILWNVDATRLQSVKHKLNQQHVLAAEVDSSIATLTQVDVDADVAFPDAVENQLYTITQKPEMFYDAALGNAVRPANVIVPAVPHGGWSLWTLVMDNLPVTPGVLLSCPANTVHQVEQCGNFINHNHNGMYIWATADPVVAGGGWACPNAPTQEVYVGQKRAEGGVKARCRDYNPDVLPFNNVGAHQPIKTKFQTALTQCKCLYHRHYHYGNAALSYILDHQGGAVPPFGSAGYLAFFQGRQTRSVAVPARKFRFQPDGTTWKIVIDAEERALICEVTGGVWRFLWNTGGRPADGPPCL